MDVMIHNELQIGKTIGLSSMRAEEHILVQVTPVQVIGPRVFTRCQPRADDNHIIVIKRRRIVFGVAIMALLALAIWFTFRSREPQYQGKKLSLWVRQLESAQDIESPLWREAVRPVRQIGTNALPSLIASLQASDPRWKTEAADWVQQVLNKDLSARLAACERQRSLMGIPVLGPLARPAIPALVTQGLLYERMTGDARYREFTVKQRDWLLGRNPWGTTMFTEIGSEFLTDVHLKTTQLRNRPVRGGLIDGPVHERIFKSLKGVSITEPDPLSAFQGPAVYHDAVKDYSTNEPTMDGTASAILMFVLCNDTQP